MSAIFNCANVGCKASYGTESKLERHKARCPQQPDACPQCSSLVPRRIMSRHVAEECDHRIVSCLKCSEEMLAVEIEPHRESCPKKEVVCTHCQSSLWLQDFAPHEEACLRKKCCCYREIGCCFRAEVGELEEHQKDLDAHFRLMAEAVGGATDAGKKMAERNHELDASNSAMRQMVEEIRTMCEDLGKALLGSKSGLESRPKGCEEPKGDFEPAFDELKGKIKEAGKTMEDVSAKHERRIEDLEAKVKALEKKITSRKSPVTLKGLVKSEIEKGMKFVAQVPFPSTLNDPDMEIFRALDFLQGRAHKCYFKQERQDDTLLFFFSIYKPESKAEETDGWPPIKKVLFCVLDPEGGDGGRMLLFKDLRCRVDAHRLAFQSDGIPDLPALAACEGKDSTFRVTLLCFNGPEQ